MAKANRKRRGRGEGGVRLRPDGRWEGTVSLGFGPDGKRNRRTVYGATKGEVIKGLDQLRAEYGMGQWADPGNMTVAGWLSSWLSSSVKPTKSPTTHERYASIVELHIVPSVGRLQLAKLAPTHVHGMVGRLMKAGSASTARKGLTVLGIACHQAIRFNLINRNPCAGVPRPRVTSEEIVILSEDELAQLLNGSRRRRLYAVLALASGTGMRQGEILGLHWSEIDFTAGTVTVKHSLAQTKTGFLLKEPKSKRSRRVLHLPRFVVEALREHRDRMRAEGWNVTTGPAFVSRRMVGKSPTGHAKQGGGWIRKSNLTRSTFEPSLKAAGLRDSVRFHDLRHSFASHLLLQGVSLKAVSEQLGHASPMTTLRIYAHLLPGSSQEIARKVDDLFGPKICLNGGTTEGRFP